MLRRPLNRHNQVSDSAEVTRGRVPGGQEPPVATVERVVRRARSSERGGMTKTWTASEILPARVAGT